MIAGYSADQVRAAEAPLLAAGVPLMQRAAAGLAREVLGMLDGVRGSATPNVLALVGAGNNGADALYAAAILAADGVDVAIVRTADRVHDAALRAALAAGAREEAAGEVRRLAASAGLVVDGILGTGTGTGAGSSAALRGLARELVAAVLEAAPDATVVAVDLPSGIGPDDGSVPDPVVLRATVTVTFGGYKAGLLRAPGSHYAGEVRLVDIGLGDELAKVRPVVRFDELGDPER